MRILFDHGTPAPLIWLLSDHSVTTALEAGWDRLANGYLLRAAEDGGYELLLTTDKRIRYQQNLKGRKIAIVVLGNSRWPIDPVYMERIVDAVNKSTEGSYFEVEIPFVRRRRPFEGR